MLVKEKRTKKASPIVAIVCLVVIAVLLLIYAFNKPAMGKYKRYKAKKEIAFHEKSLGVLYKETGECPVFQQDNLPDKFMKGKFTRDPWGHRYAVMCPDENSVVVFSVGPDGTEGTEDDFHDDDK